MLAQLRNAEDLLSVTHHSAKRKVTTKTRLWNYTKMGIETREVKDLCNRSVVCLTPPPQVKLHVSYSIYFIFHISPISYTSYFIYFLFHIFQNFRSHIFRIPYTSYFIYFIFHTFQISYISYISEFHILHISYIS